MEVMEKPYEIFNAVRDRFRKVSPVAVGFPLSVRHNVDFNEFRFGLDREHQGGGYSTLNVKKANVPFAAIYDPTGPFDPMMTLDRAAWIAILEGPLKGRQLYIDPREEAHIRGVLDDESMSAMAVRLSLNDGPAAARHYRRFRQLLRDELDEEPSERLTELYREATVRT